MAAYDNLRTLLLNRLLRTSWAATVNVGAARTYTTPGAALAAIKANTVSPVALGLPSSSNRIRILCDDGNYTETACIDFSATNAQYVDLCGSGPRDDGDTTGVSITCATASTDVIKMGGCQNMLFGLKIVQSASTGSSGYGVHVDGNPLDIADQLMVIYNCKVTATKSAALGIGLFGKQRLFIVDCPLLESTLATTVGRGVYWHDQVPAQDSTGNSRMAIIGSTMKGYPAGIMLFPNGAYGFSRVLLSGCSFECTVAGGADLLFYSTAQIVGSAQMPDGSGTLLPKTWSQSTTKILAYQKTYQGKPFYYNDFVYGQGASDYTSAGYGLWTLYWSPSKAAWILYPSYNPGATARATAPHTFEANIDGAGYADYFKWVTPGGWNSKLAQMPAGVGAFAAVTGPQIQTARADASGIGFTDNLLVMYDGGSFVASAPSPADGRNVQVNLNGSQTNLTDKKGYSYINSECIIPVYNGIAQAISWLDAFDPSYAAAGDVETGVNRGDGVTGTLVPGAPVFGSKSGGK